MAKAVISSILQSQLGKYVDGLAPESLQVGLWSGELLLTNLKLKPLALAELNLPIKVLQGTIAKVHVVVPWNQLGSASVQVTLEGIYGVAIPNTELPSPEEVLLGIRNRLERGELMRQHTLQTSSSGTSSDPKEDESTFLTRLTTRIIDNLQITIKDLHIRYEDTVSNPSLPFTCGLFLERFSLETTDANGRKIFVDNTAGEKKGLTHKVAQVKNLALYWDRLDPADSMTRQSAAFEAAMRRVIYATSAFAETDRHWLLVPPCTVRVRLTKNESRMYSQTSPKFAVHAEAIGVAFGLSREQYDDMLFMHKAFLSRRAVEAHFWEHRHRPFLPLRQYPVVWWDYATRFIIATSTGKATSRFRWSVVKKMARDRKMYVALYKQQQLAKTPALSLDQSAYVQSMEDAFPMELVLRLREVAEAQFAAQKKATPAPAASSSWYGYFFGDASASTASANDVLTDAGKADLKRAYEETVALDEAALPVDCFLLTIDIALRDGRVGLYGYNNTPLLSSALTGSIGVQVQPDESWTSQVQLDRLEIANHRVDASCASRAFCTLRQGSSDVPFALRVAMPTPTTLHVRLSAEPLQFVLDPVFLLLLYDFFCGSVAQRQLNDVWAFATSSVQSYVFAEQEEADMLAAISAAETMKYDVIVDMKAPVLLLPEDATSDTSAVVVLDFGRLKLTDVAPSSAHVHTWQVELNEMQVLLHGENGFAPNDPGVALVPRFNMACRVDSMVREMAGKPLLSMHASLPAINVAMSEESLAQLGRMHAAIYLQCQAVMAQTRPPDIEDDDGAGAVVAAPVPRKTSRDSHAIALTWDIDAIDIALADSFRVLLTGTSFGYDLYGSKTSAVAKLRAFSVEDKAHAPSSPYYYLAKTPDTSSHLIHASLVSSQSPDRAADTVITADFQVLEMQWNPSSIVVLNSLVSTYTSSLVLIAPPLPHATSLSASTLGASMARSRIPSLLVTATLEQFSVSLNKDSRDRRLVTLSMTNASLHMTTQSDASYTIDGTLGNFLVEDHSVQKHSMYNPFVGLDPAATTTQLLSFAYVVPPAPALPTLDACLDHVRIVYVHQQVLELVDYLFQGVLGSLLLLKEEPSALKLHVNLVEPRIVIPMHPMDTQHLLLAATSLELSHVPASTVVYDDGRVVIVYEGEGMPADVKHVVLDQVMLFATTKTAGEYAPVLETPLQLDIAIKDVVSTTLVMSDGVVLPRFSIECVMPRLHMRLSKAVYVMLVRVLQENIGAATLIDGATTGSASISDVYRPIVAYDYARTDLEMLTMRLSFSMASPRIEVGLATFGASEKARDWLSSSGQTRMQYAWDDVKRSCSLDLDVSNVSGTVVPSALLTLVQFFHLDAAMLQSNASSPAPTADAEYEFHVQLHASKVGLHFPSDLADHSRPLLAIESDFAIAFDSYPPDRNEATPMAVVIEATQFEAYLRNTNRQGCATSFVQLMEPTNLRMKYQFFTHAQEKMEVSISTVTVFVSYEDTQLLSTVVRALSADVAMTSHASSLPSMELNFVKETQRHMTWDVQSMQLTLINDCDGCDMGLLQLRLPTCRLFVNAATTFESSTVTGGGDLSFEATYYNPDSRTWQPLCAEWKLNATVMSTLGHVSSDANLNSMQWTVSADPLNVSVTHGLLEALASAGETWANGKHDRSLQAPCTIVNESGLPLRFWWSANAHDVQVVDHGSSACIHYVHVQGNGSGVTRTYTSQQREQGTVCLDLVGLGCQPVQGIVAEELGTHAHSLVELSGGLSNFKVTCTSQLVGGHIVLTISSHVRIHSHVSEKVQLLVYDPSWNAPMDIGTVAPGDSIALPVMYSLGSEIRLRCLGNDWSFSSPIPLDMTSASLTVSCTHPTQVAFFCVSFEQGHVHLYDPLTLENKCPLPITFQARDGSRGVARGETLSVGATAGIWWAMHQPLFALDVPGCDISSWLPLKKDNLKPFSLVVRRRGDRRPMTILVALRENAAKALTISLYADVWLINRTGVDLAFGNEVDDECYRPSSEAQSIIDDAPMTMYSSGESPALLRVRHGNAKWSAYVKADPRRMNWQDECLSVASNGRLYELGVSADYATRHFGVLTTIVTLTPRYLFVNRSPWTIILLEDDGALPSNLTHVDHMVPPGDSYALYWMQGVRRRLRASVLDCPGQSSWSEPFGINELRTMELLVPNDVSCPILQVVVKQGGLTQSTYVIDMVNLDLEPLPETKAPTWDLVTVDVKVASVTMTLLDTSKEVDLFTGPVLEEVARFKIFNIRMDLFKDRVNAQSHLRIGSMALQDLLPRTKYPLVVSPSKSSSSRDFIVVAYKDKVHPKYHYIESLEVYVQDVSLQTSMSFVNRINGLITETLGHFTSARSLDLVAYFNNDDLASLTGRKWFFERLAIRPIHATVSFVKDASSGDATNFWLANLKLKIKDASLVLDGYTLANALATQESVLEALSRFYVGSVKSQALGLVESIQVIPLVTGVVTEGVSTLVSTLWGKADSTLASSSFRRESLSNSAIVSKHSRGVASVASPAQLQNVLHHLVFDWDGNHTGLEARACMALGLINNSSQSIVVQATLRDGAELRSLPNGRQHLAPGLAEWQPDRALLLFAWGYTPTLLTTGDVSMNVQSNAFTLTISKSFTRLQANPGYTATFTLQESQTWWAKHMVVVSDDLPSIQTTAASAAPDAQSAYEILFDSDTLGIVARQVDQNTVAVRECCRFSNGQPSPALACGLIAEGDLILSVNGLPVRTTSGFKAAIVNTPRPLVVRFARKPAIVVEDENAFNLFG
ncbi:hypothetical protein SDRG_08935 [Saprolegnia diclina VS20]|uniref:PDZ domain-containing protein n=1 Tax=Saprolegnia diclina (strain VS20) TaxID=1156394 RepID=T0QI70_SAPDV|nr:hypothetical protein SDRG_08935 [Saprolegnia diclina VS20]EQC33420.1 hypothetical protein SDRG_08935 [Saprolegnia diclina VS20]|eukprot:XP_008613060.1 hypothetical protein SDRG_08935 [Saprolegnia diclina VS20]